MKRRVLFVISSPLSNAGVPNVVMLLARALHEKYTFDIVVNGKNEGYYDQEFQRLGGKVFRANLIDYNKHPVFYPYRYFQLKKIINSILEKNDYSVIHCNNGIESGILVKCAYIKGVPVRLVHAHGNYNRGGINVILHLYRRLNKRWIKKYSNALVACSDVAGTSLFEELRFENIYNPVDVKKYENIKHIPHNECNLLQIGYYCKLKNQMFSLQLLKELLEKGVPATLTFIGFALDENYYSEIKKFVLNENIEKYVTFLPKDADKIEVLSLMDYVLIPSLSEGFSIVSLEGQASNTMCLISDRVPRDCDFGLAAFMDINDVSRWSSFIINGDKSNYFLNRDKLKKVDSRFYIETLEKIYGRSKE